MPSLLLAVHNTLSEQTASQIATAYMKWRLISSAGGRADSGKKREEGIAIRR